MDLPAYLFLSLILFGIGAFGFLARRNAIMMLICIELMLNAVNLSLVAFNAFDYGATNDAGAVFSLLIMAVAAAEATVGPGPRHRHHPHPADPRGRRVLRPEGVGR